MSKDFKCEVCRRTAETLHMRNSDGKWVCTDCIPAAEMNLYPGLRADARERKSARGAATRKKAA